MKLQELLLKPDKEVGKIQVAILDIEKLTSKTNDPYLRMQISDGNAYTLLYVWKYAEFAPNGEDLYNKKQVITVNARHIAGKSQFLSCDAIDIEKIQSLEDLSVDHPIRKMSQFQTVPAHNVWAKARAMTDIAVTNPAWLAFLEFALTEKMFLDIQDSPAAKSVHHSQEGGLLVHIYEMLCIYDSIRVFCVCETTRPELLITGIVFHDYFKKNDYVVGASENAYTEDYALLGHLFQGAHFIINIINAYNAKQTDKDLKISQMDKKLVAHVLLAHHSQLEWGSPVVPATKEAVLLHYIDQISAKFNQIDNTGNMQYNKFLGTSVVK